MATSAALLAFLEGAGLAHLQVSEEDADKFLRESGSIVRAAVEGLIGLLLARSELKKEMRAEDRTMVASRDNNPLKLMTDPQEAMGYLFDRRERLSGAFLPPVQAVHDACDDLRVHEIALMAGMRAAFQGALKRFEPQLIEREVDKQKGSFTLNKKVKLWDAQTDQEVASLHGHRSAVQCVAFSPDGKRLASGSTDHTVKLWNAQTGGVTTTLLGHTSEVSCVAISHDGKLLASGSQDNSVKLWDAQTGQEVTALKRHGGWVPSVAFSPDGKRLASASWDNSLILWNAQTGQETATLIGHTKKVTSVAFSPDSK